MNVEAFRNYCLGRNGTVETFPFDDGTLVFKVMGKAYALTGLDDNDFRVNLKCDPERALELRERYPDIIPGWHMNKKHWNTMYMERGLDPDLIIELIDHSYELVCRKLSKKDQEALAAMKKE